MSGSVLRAFRGTTEPDAGNYRRRDRARRMKAHRDPRYFAAQRIGDAADSWR
jgi:hypothetical protein